MQADRDAEHDAPHLMTPQQYSLCSISSRMAGRRARRLRPLLLGEPPPPPPPPGGGGLSASGLKSPMAWLAAGTSKRLLGPRCQGSQDNCAQVP